MRYSTARNEFTRRAHRLMASSVKRCLAPGTDCPKPAIQAHSIQRQGALKQLATKGHVVMLRGGSSLQTEPEARLRLVGVQKASVFGGLCREHDREIFRTIDIAPFEMDNLEHRFLHAYRAVLREAHATIEAGSKLQSIYLAQTDLGLIPRDVPTPEGMFAVERMRIAYEMWMYKQRFDALLASADYEGVRHDVFELAGTHPVLAAAALFSLDDVPVGDDVARAALSIIPSTSGSTVVLFSYVDTDAEAARSNLKHVLESTGVGDTYPLSRLVLERCENVALAPQVVKRWSEGKKRVVTEFYNSTVLDDNTDFNHPDLDLFTC